MLITFINYHYTVRINKTEVVNYDFFWIFISQLNTKQIYVESETIESLYNCYYESHDTPYYFCISAFLDKDFKCAQRIEINYNTSLELLLSEQNRTTSEREVGS